MFRCLQDVGISREQDAVAISFGVLGASSKLQLQRATRTVKLELIKLNDAQERRLSAYQEIMNNTDANRNNYLDTHTKVKIFIVKNHLVTDQCSKIICFSLAKIQDSCNGCLASFAFTT